MVYSIIEYTFTRTIIILYAHITSKKVADTSDKGDSDLLLSGFCLILQTNKWDKMNGIIIAVCRVNQQKTQAICCIGLVIFFFLDFVYEYVSKSSKTT